MEETGGHGAAPAVAADLHLLGKGVDDQEPTVMRIVRVRPRQTRGARTASGVGDEDLHGVEGDGQAEAECACGPAAVGVENGVGRQFADDHLCVFPVRRATQGGTGPAACAAHFFG
jgi:hypothetical protein